jgi:pimeloyl-ACP methyl ester carboxylesterase
MTLWGMFFLPLQQLHAEDAVWPAKTLYRYASVEGKRIFYREAGESSKPTIILLHGFPSTSHTYRELIPLLSGRYHVIAPDYLGFGYSDHPDPDDQPYDFDLLAKYVIGLMRTLGIKRYVMYMQDFGAPVGYRVMMHDPESLSGLIVQNANAYMEGLTEPRQAFFRNAHDDRSKENIAKLYDFVGREAIVQKQYLRDVKGREEIMSPDSWANDLVFLETEKQKTIQVQLFQDYYTNLLAYPKWQAFLREKQPPTLIVWGKNDPAFIAAGAQAYLKDLPNAELHLIDAGHFAVEEKPVEVAKFIIEFMGKLSSLSKSTRAQPHITTDETSLMPRR